MSVARGGTASGPRLLAAVVLSACVGLVGGGLAAWGVYAHFGPVERVISENKAGGTTVSVSDVVAAVEPAVVTVSTQPINSRGLAGGDVSGLAEGFVVSTDGLVVTTARAVRGASRLRVATADGHAYSATIAASNPALGLVVLRAAGASGLPVLRWAAAAPRIGDLALVVSRPALGAVNARSGVVAATAVTASDGTTAVGDLLTVDATPAAGAEGAPLVDGGGAVLGVVSEIPNLPGVIAASGRDAAALVSSAGSGSPAQPAGFGLASVFLGAATAAAAGLPQGALITAVDPSGPAAGLLQAGQVVTQVNGAAVATTLAPAAFGLQPGQPATLTVIGSDGVSHSVSLTVAAAA